MKITIWKYVHHFSKIWFAKEAWLQNMTKVHHFLKEIVHKLLKRSY